MSDIVERLGASNTVYGWINRQNIEAAAEIQSLRQQLADTQRKLEAAEIAIAEAKNIRETNLHGDFCVTLTFASCRSASAFKQAIEQSKGGDA